MSCSEGHGSWVSTTNGACFATRHGSFQSCFCPISTCAMDSEGYYGCEFTYLSYFIIYLLIALLVAGCVAYYVYDRRVRALAGKKAPQPMDWRSVNDNMFGVYHTNAEGGDSSTNATNSNVNTARGEKGSSSASVVAGTRLSANDASENEERKGLLSSGGASYGSTAAKRA